MLHGQTNQSTTSKRVVILVYALHMYPIYLAIETEFCVFICT